MDEGAFPHKGKLFSTFPCYFAGRYTPLEKLSNSVLPDHETNHAADALEKLSLSTFRQKW